MSQRSWREDLYTYLTKTRLCDLITKHICVWFGVCVCGVGGVCDSVWLETWRVGRGWERGSGVGGWVSLSGTRGSTGVCIKKSIDIIFQKLRKTHFMHYLRILYVTLTFFVHYFRCWRLLWLKINVDGLNCFYKCVVRFCVE